MGGMYHSDTKGPVGAGFIPVRGSQGVLAARHFTGSHGFELPAGSAMTHNGFIQSVFATTTRNLGAMKNFLTGAVVAAFLVPAIGFAEDPSGRKVPWSLVGAELEKSLAVEYFEPTTLESGVVLLPKIGTSLALPASPTEQQVETDDEGSESPQNPLAGRTELIEKYVGPCDATCKWLSAGLSAAGVAALAFLDEEDARTIGDITQILPIIGAFTMPFVAKDKEGMKQFFYAGGTAFALSHGFKEITEKARPNESDGASFPSGHTSAAFFGAAFIGERYGPRWAVPGYVMGFYTGFTRVNSQKHYLDDVVSGMSIGLMSSWLLATPISQRVALNPTLVEDGWGLSVSVSMAKDVHRETYGEDTKSRPNFRFQWEFGDIHVTENLILPTGGGDPIDFRFDGVNDPSVSGSADLVWYFGGGRHALDFRLTPFELRDFGMLEEDIDFGGETVPGGVELRSGYVAYDFRAHYGYAVFPESRFELEVGGGLSALYTLAELAVIIDLEDREVEEFATIDDVSVLPTLYLHLGYRFGKNERWLLFAEADGIDISSDRYLNATAQLRFQASRKWDVGLGYRYFERYIDHDGFDNLTARDQYVAAIGYRF